MGISVGIVGLGFGAAFVPIYQRHPGVDRVGICETNPTLLAEVGDRCGVEDRFSSLEELLVDERYDAVHLLTPVPFHVEHTLAVLGAGKHCACAVPMATDLKGLTKVIDAVRESGRNYMMMETARYSREFFFLREMIDSGEMGNLTFLRGTYYQDLAGDYPRYWWSMPPMHYATHALSPLLGLVGKPVAKVCCMGSGTMPADIQQPGGNSFPLQTALLRLADSDLVIELTRSWFQVARSYTEAFSVYGDRRGFEWQQLEHEDPVLYTLEPVVPGERWRDARAERVPVPFRPDLLPSEIAGFADGGHGGSHPHLVHEFVSSILEGRSPAIDAVTAAEWTVPGICAHESALRDGDPVSIPQYR